LKWLIDENLPPALAHALDALFKDEHQIVHLRERFGPGVTDIEWITTLGREGRWIVISGDLRITKVKAEYFAFRASRLVGFFLSPSLKKADVAKQMERILALWDNMSVIAEAVDRGAMFELPMKSTRPRQLK
jgi:hypothetical protein